MNALTLLTEDHHNVEALFKRFEAAGPEEHAERTRVRDLVVEHLSVHAGLEELVFYPALREASEETEQLVLEALEEHHMAKLALSEIEKLSPTDERFTAKMTVLIENVRHHVEEEESELFDAARKALGHQLEDIGEQMVELRPTVPTRPHPLAPDEPPLNAIVNMPFAIAERMVKVGRDAASKVFAAGRR
jgi:hemerythrin-like domain-containing protein